MSSYYPLKGTCVGLIHYLCVNPPAQSLCNVLISDVGVLSGCNPGLSVKMRKNLHHLLETTFSLISLSQFFCVCVCMCVSFPPCSHRLSVVLHLSQICCQKLRRELFWWETREEMERWWKHCRYISPLLTLKVHCGPLDSVLLADLSWSRSLLSLVL